MGSRRAVAISGPASCAHSLACERVRRLMEDQDEMRRKKKEQIAGSVLALVYYCTADLYLDHPTMSHTLSNPFAALSMSEQVIET